MEVTKIFRFESAHSVKDAYTSRCDRKTGGIHGHSYVVEVTLEGNLKKDGMVLDFTLLKEKFNHIIDAFDHTFVVNSLDLVMVKLAPYLSARFIIFPENPTAENMAQYFYDYIGSTLDRENAPIQVKSITVWETVTGKATKTRVSDFVIPPATLIVSAAVRENWTKEEFKTFALNGGVDLTAYPLITDLDIQVKDVDGTLNIVASVFNCK